MKKWCFLAVFVLVLFVVDFYLVDTRSHSVSSLSSGLSNNFFGRVSVDLGLVLRGHGSNVDSLDFWVAPRVRDSLLFVTSKNSNLVQVWKFPFEGNELEPLRFPHSANGVAVDQVNDVLYVGLRSPESVHVFSLPRLEELSVFAASNLGGGETNLDVLYQPNGRALVYVTDNSNVYVYDAGSLELLYKFTPVVSSIETVLADSFHQRIFVPEEQGAGGLNPGIHVFTPTGKPLVMNGSNVFASGGVFQADEEGIALYRCLSGGVDTGSGFIIVSDQIHATTDFEFFDRESFQHLGTLTIRGVGNTDGVAVSEIAFPGYPDGLFAVIDNDALTVIVGFKEIFAVTNLSC